MLQSIVPSRFGFAVRFGMSNFDNSQNAQNTLYIFLPSFLPYSGTALFAPEVGDIDLFHVECLLDRSQEFPTPTYMLQFLLCRHVSENRRSCPEGRHIFFTHGRRPQDREDLRERRCAVNTVKRTSRTKRGRGVVNGRWKNERMSRWSAAAEAEKRRLSDPVKQTVTRSGWCF